VDKETLKIIIKECETVVDGFVMGHPVAMIAWAFVKATLLSDAVLDKLLANLVAKGVTASIQPQ
jgi:hypothetical protein